MAILKTKFQLESVKAGCEHFNLNCRINTAVVPGGVEAYGNGWITLEDALILVDRQNVALPTGQNVSLPTGNESARSEVVGVAHDGSVEAI